MSAEPLADQHGADQRIIKRTLTITTVETWTITIEMEQTAPSFQPDRTTPLDREPNTDRAYSNPQEEK